MLTLDRTRHTADRAVRLKDVQSETNARVPGVHCAACTIRSATIEDMPEVAAIYASFVEKTTVTSEIVAPDEAEMVRRLQSVRDHDLPYLVAELEGYVVGYCYAAQFRPRAGYRYTVEDSIYIRPDCTGYGVGKLLLGELISGCKRRDATAWSPASWESIRPPFPFMRRWALNQWDSFLRPALNLVDGSASRSCNVL